jgi:hypothetical protein
MSEVFRNMIRTACRQILRLGAMRGSVSVTARFGAGVDVRTLQDTLQELMTDKAVAGGEVWSAADASEFPVAEEERLRGGDRRIGACLILDALRPADAETIAADFVRRFPGAAVGIYRLLCEIRPAVTPRPSPP